VLCLGAVICCKAALKPYARDQDKNRVRRKTKGHHGTHSAEEKKGEGGFKKENPGFNERKTYVASMIPICGEKRGAKTGILGGVGKRTFGALSKTRRNEEDKTGLGTPGSNVSQGKGTNVFGVG